jgi:hypothetical protein
VVKAIVPDPRSAPAKHLGIGQVADFWRAGIGKRLHPASATSRLALPRGMRKYGNSKRLNKKSPK